MCSDSKARITAATIGQPSYILEFHTAHGLTAAELQQLYGLHPRLSEEAPSVAPVGLGRTKWTANAAYLL